MCLCALVLAWFCIKVRRGFGQWNAAGGGNLLFDHFLFFFGHIIHSIKPPIKDFLRDRPNAPLDITGFHGLSLYIVDRAPSAQQGRLARCG
ncbi:hypothetical protein CENSYa_0948 [Cenarchaeum symbiosum A]|uniref:Uncharacterized protein n=1 Tax=Cenarchaeum symbiosum (strain A) TaxID=414004 RepID=A0RW63_CENSY|nr:hypothetical protein CENSYa_0948 [Cenarchaeum symbiosum A]